jgi:hypothetical protein
LIKKAIEAAVKANKQELADDLTMGLATATNEEPVRTRYMTSDTTVEKLGELLAAKAGHARFDALDHGRPLRRRQRFGAGKYRQAVDADDANQPACS